MNTSKNRLQHEQSLYLQQHATNPIDWFPWSTEAFDKAKNENKLLFISIGYSSCHWCHVMEKEVFEKEEVAEYINRYFVCIKVDREERPDVDNVYMSAVQLMNQNGGWPLNCFALADGRPIFGGTYFPKPHFMNILQTLVELQENDYRKMLEYADSLQNGLNAINIIQRKDETDFTEEKFHTLVKNWSTLFDWKNGGNKRAPKFPMPNNYDFLLRYGRFYGEEAVVEFTHFTLHEILRGGIYDQIEGGLMRYSVDMYWKEPHFEKMLYDNGQFLSVLAHAQIDSPSMEYEFVLKQTIHWLKSTMRNEIGLFKSSIDADAAGEEGSYYFWEKEELEKLFPNDFKQIEELYQINGNGFWKEGKYILLRNQSHTKFIENQNFTELKFNKWITETNTLLLNHRLKRIAPVIDSKILFSWNCMIAIGLVDTAIALKENTYFKDALNLVESLEKTHLEGNQLYRIADSNNKITGCLDDYVYYIQTCIKIHQYTLNSDWLVKAIHWIDVIENTFEKQESLYHYAAKDPLLISNSIETEDNVIPASNSVLANCYWDLGVLHANYYWLDKAKEMLQCVHSGMENYGSGYSNWAILLHKIIKGDLLVTYLGTINHEEHLEQLFKLHDSVLFKINTKSQAEKSFEICHHQSCSLPIEGYNLIYPHITALLNKA